MKSLARYQSPLLLLALERLLFGQQRIAQHQKSSDNHRRHRENGEHEGDDSDSESGGNRVSDRLEEIRAHERVRRKYTPTPMIPATPIRAAIHRPAPLVCG